MPQTLSRICVFCGSRGGNGDNYAELARETGQVIGERGLGLVYGGGGRGMMGTVANSALAAGAKVVGVIPRALFQRENLHQGLHQVHEVADMLERKALMASLSDGFLVLPGGLGTLDELFEMLTWLQLGIHPKPIALVDNSGFFDTLLQFLDEIVDHGFLDSDARATLLRADTPGAAIDALAGFTPAIGPYP